MDTESIKLLFGINNINTYELIWILVGFIGQLTFFSRWLVQWLLSERYSKSYIPNSFWWLSLIGGFITFLYAWHIKSLPFMLAQFIGLIVYIRNITLILKK
tara:strand:- start:535 stop:837 length:303 start_codon:yes stop_codon:yes gene_type:complete